jgi:hypothetical protein
MIPMIVEAVQEIAAKIEKMATDFVTKKVTTEELCVGTEAERTCVNKTQFDSMMQGGTVIINQGSAPSTPSTNWSASTTASTTTDQSATSTGTTTDNTVDQAPTSPEAPADTPTDPAPEAQPETTTEAPASETPTETPTVE